MSKPWTAKELTELEGLVAKNLELSEYKVFKIISPTSSILKNHSADSIRYHARKIRNDLLKEPSSDEEVNNGSNFGANEDYSIELWDTY